MQIGKTKKAKLKSGFSQVQGNSPSFVFLPFTCHLQSTQVLNWWILWSHHAQLTILLQSEPYRRNKIEKIVSYASFFCGSTY
mgnify:CR=1 FL=1